MWHDELAAAQHLLHVQCLFLHENHCSICLFDEMNGEKVSKKQAYEDNNLRRNRISSEILSNPTIKMGSLIYLGISLRQGCE
jgi:hypothetical protein